MNIPSIAVSPPPLSLMCLLCTSRTLVGYSLLYSVRLRSLALAMNVPIRCSDWWGQIALDELKREGVPYEVWSYEMLEEHAPDFRLKTNRFG